MKTEKEHFSDWESHVFGYGYGTGEPVIVPALVRFMAVIPDNGGYDFRELERVTSPETAWLLINALCHADLIEYGTSPRFGWLTPQGRALRRFVADWSLEDLVRFCSERPERFVPCMPDYCNCDDGPCHNPFWAEHRA